MKDHGSTNFLRGMLAAIFLLGAAGASTLHAAEEAKLLPADGAANDQFGHSVGLEGDTAMIGSVYDDDNGQNSGSVYVFAHSAGIWTQEAKLLPSTVQEFLLFGASLSLDGDTVVIGAWGDDQNGDHAGAAFVFDRAGGVWTEGAKLTPADPAVDDYFGRDVALDGNTVLIGAWADDDNGSRSGSAYVFTRTGGVWTQQAKLLADDGAMFDRFGETVALDGDTALIGARSNDQAGDNAGAAYVFTRTGGVWTQQAKLVAADGGNNDNFSQGLALDGDTAIVGANGHDEITGAAYVYTRTGGAWTQQAKLIHAGSEPGDGFGGSVTLEGDTALIAALGDDGNGDNTGSVYVFTRAAGVWTQQAKLAAGDGAYFDLFGFQTALDGDAAVVGVLRDDDFGNDSGSAYVFRPLEDSNVPAHGPAGLALLLLTILGGGTYFVRTASRTKT